MIARLKLGFSSKLYIVVNNECGRLVVYSDADIVFGPKLKVKLTSWFAS